MIYLLTISMLSTDPLPPTHLQVVATTTTSVKIEWQYESSDSFCLKWNIKYTEDAVPLTTNVDQLKVTITSLAPGQTYAINVLCVTIDDLVGQKAAQVEATASKYI